MIITPLPYYPLTKVAKCLPTVQTTIIEDKIISFSAYTLNEEDLPTLVKKKADFELAKQAKKLGADAILAVHYVPFTTKFDGGNQTDDSYSMYAYGAPVIFKQ